MNVVISHGSGPSSQALSNLCVGSHLDRCHQTFVSVLCLFFLNWPSSSRNGRSVLSSRTWPGTRGADPITHRLAKYPLCCERLFVASVNSSNYCLDICLVNVHLPRFGCPSREDISHGSHLAPCATEPQQEPGPHRFSVLRLGLRIPC